MLMLLLPRNFQYHSQITTRSGVDLEKPTFKKGAAFVFERQVVTFESKGDVCVFSRRQENQKSTRLIHI